MKLSKLTLLTISVALFSTAPIAQLNQKIENLPIITESEISVFNNFTAPIDFRLEAMGCDEKVTLASGVNRKFSCGASKEYKTTFFAKNKDGVVAKKTMTLPAGAHYHFGVASDMTATIIDIRVR